MKIDEYTIKRIKDTARIEDVIGDFVRLRKTGVRYTGICPFHNDRHDGNFIVHPVKQCFKCFTCGVKGGVVDFVMRHLKLSYPDAIRWLGRRYCIETDSKVISYTAKQPRQLPPPLTMLSLPWSMVTRSEEDRESDLLVRWIRNGIHWDAAQRARIDEVLDAYHVGHGRNGHTIWWQIDEQTHVRTGKMMKYRADGHRDKIAKWNFDWVHSAIARPVIVNDANGYPMFDDTGHVVTEQRNKDIYDEQKHEVKPTLFGMHLLNRHLNATVCIVESEKTAVLMAIAYGNHAGQVWMACGGLEMLSRERLAPIIQARRKVILYPDRDGILKWHKKASALDYDRLTVDAKPVTKWWRPEDGEKADIADVVIRSINDITKW